jgi:hypothetical protein
MGYPSQRTYQQITKSPHEKIPLIIKSRIKVHIIKELQTDGIAANIFYFSQKKKTVRVSVLLSYLEVKVSQAATPASTMSS